MCAMIPLLILFINLKLKTVGGKLLRETRRVIQ